MDHTQAAAHVIDRLRGEVPNLFAYQQNAPAPGAVMIRGRCDPPFASLDAMYALEFSHVITAADAAAPDALVAKLKDQLRSTLDKHGLAAPF